MTPEDRFWLAAGTAARPRFAPDRRVRVVQNRSAILSNLAGVIPASLLFRSTDPGRAELMSRVAERVGLLAAGYGRSTYIIHPRIHQDSRSLVLRILRDFLGHRAVGEEGETVRLHVEIRAVLVSRPSLNVFGSKRYTVTGVDSLMWL